MVVSLYGSWRRSYDVRDLITRIHHHVKGNSFHLLEGRLLDMPESICHHFSPDDLSASLKADKWAHLHYASVWNTFFKAFSFLEFLSFFCSCSYKWARARYRRFECNIQWIPASTFSAANKQTSRGAAVAPSGLFWPALTSSRTTNPPGVVRREREPGEPTQPQSFQSALAGSTTLLCFLPFLPSFPSFPLKLGTQESWPYELISSKGMSRAHSGALRMRWSSFIAL